MKQQAIPVPTRKEEKRRHPRAQLGLPVRLRWLSPLGSLTDVTETLDVSKGGLLVRLAPGSREPCRVRAMLYVTFPFDPEIPLTQPETPARVVRVEETQSGGQRVAIEFAAPLHRPRAASPEAGRKSDDRRRCERIPLALPIHVRPSGSPWPEETMTIDVSTEGVLFSTARLYTVGDLVTVTLAPGSILNSSDYAREVPARVVRVARLTGTVEHRVALVLLPNGKR